MGFETLELHQERAVVFAEIAAPPMNLLGPELVRDLVSIIQRAEADDEVRVIVFKSADPTTSFRTSSVSEHSLVLGE